MKRIFVTAALVVAMVSMLVIGTGGVAGARQVEGIYFKVTCLLPKFTSPGNTTSCSGPATGVGTAFRGNTTATASNVHYNEPNCLLGNATGTFKVQAASGPFSYRRVGAIALITFSNINGAGFTAGKGNAVALFGQATPADTLKVVKACAGTPQTSVRVTVTGISIAYDT